MNTLAMQLVGSQWARGLRHEDEPICRPTFVIIVSGSSRFEILGLETVSFGSGIAMLVRVRTN